MNTAAALPPGTLRMQARSRQWRHWEWVALAGALLAHLALLAILSLGRTASDPEIEVEAKPIDISLVDDVAVESVSQNRDAEAMSSIAPDAGKPEDAPPPEAVEVPPEPAPAKVDVPAPKPAPVAKPAPKEPPARKAERAPEKPAKPAQKPALARPSEAGTNPKSTKSRPTGALLGDNFLGGVVANPTKGTAKTPRAEKLGAEALANLASAIQRQVQPCANRIPNPGPGANEILSRVRLQMAADGTMRARPELRGQTGITDENERYARRVAEGAIAAFIQCAPYKLPADLYDAENGWKDIIIKYKLP